MSDGLNVVALYFFNYKGFCSDTLTKGLEFMKCLTTKLCIIKKGIRTILSFLFTVPYPSPLTFYLLTLVPPQFFKSTECQMDLMSWCRIFFNYKGFCSDTLTKGLEFMKPFCDKTFGPGCVIKKAIRTILSFLFTVKAPPVDE